MFLIIMSLISSFKVHQLQKQKKKVNKLSHSLVKRWDLGLFIKKEEKENETWDPQIPIAQF
jgi:hypothetical protein